MKRELKDRWVGVLRSGQYEQTRGTLKRTLPGYDGHDEPVTAGYCCVGVLCDILSGGEWDVSSDECSFVWSDDSLDVYYFSGDLEDRSMVIAGFDADTQKELVHMNDTKRWSFEEIAAWIEENIEVDD